MCSLMILVLFIWRKRMHGQLHQRIIMDYDVIISALVIIPLPSNCPPFALELRIFIYIYIYIITKSLGYLAWNETSNWTLECGLNLLPSLILNHIKHYFRNPLLQSVCYSVMFTNVCSWIKRGKQWIFQFVSIPFRSKLQSKNKFCWSMHIL